jgi:four helix bundle protein
VCLNIAEGSAKYSDKDFHRYLENSINSINESLACLDIARDTAIITEKNFTKLFEDALNISRQLGGLSKKLRSSG